MVGNISVDGVAAPVIVDKRRSGKISRDSIRRGSPRPVTSHKATYRCQPLSPVNRARVSGNPAFMKQIDLGLLSDIWIAYWHGDSAKRIKLSEATDPYDFTYEEPEKLWLLILAAHLGDSQAGPIDSHSASTLRWTGEGSACQAR